MNHVSKPREGRDPLASLSDWMKPISCVCERHRTYGADGVDTSVAGVVSDLPSGRAEYCLDKCEWQVLQPREMNRHGRMLLRIRAGEAVELPHKTHPYYKYLESQWRKENRE